MRGSGTLYSLSKEGKGTAGPLVAGLTVAVTEAAEEFAERSPGGRLPVPMVVVLDEAANVCRWRELPNLYSHYGSRGICLLTILQSWSQGVEVWGRDGHAQAVVRREHEGLRRRRLRGRVPLRALAADRRLLTSRRRRSRTGAACMDRNVTRATERERILDVSELAGLPRGRAVVLASGAPPALVQTLPWMSGPFADEIRESLRRNDPATPQPTRARAAGEAAVSEPCYATLEDFVRELLAPMYRRTLDGTDRSWCPEWWRHAEAISRLDALWRAWEHLRLDPYTGMSVWFRDHADHHMAVLLDSEGPFKRCSPLKGHRALDELPLEPAPEGLFVPILWPADDYDAEPAS